MDRRSYDLVVRGGTVFDGTGTPGREMDVAVRAGRIVAVGPALPAFGALELDARGLAVSPGFIDIHSHADVSLFADPLAESVVRQGITTVVVGQDGGSRAPGRYPSLRRFLRAVDQLPSAINVASMVGLGTIRAMVMGYTDRRATPAELAKMRGLVEGALLDGACGISSGLEYAPGTFATQEEIAVLCQPLARRGLPYATHIRNEDDRLLESVDEAIAVARDAGCRLQISHFKADRRPNWTKAEAALERLQQARREGVDVAFDIYPYVAWATTLRLLFPPWSQRGGVEAFLGRLTDPSLRERLRESVLGRVAGLDGWDGVMISSVANPADRAAEGKRLGEYAKGLGIDPYDAVVRLLRRSGGDVGMVGFAMSEENVRLMLAHPLSMICSDGGAYALSGPAHRGHPHPRNLGAFPRVLGVYVRDTKTLTLPQAIHKMTLFPANRVRLTDRGRIALGYAADLVIFDPASVADRATFSEPFQYPVGIRTVIVNGHIALHDGIRANARHGLALHA